MLARDGTMDLGIESRWYIRSPGVEDGAVEKQQAADNKENEQ